MAGLSAQEELILLRKRARRRLVGAVVLVLVATLVLWKVVGRVQEQPMRPESVLVVGVASGPAQRSAPAASAPVAASAPAAAHADATVLPESLSTLSQPVPSQQVARAEGSAAAARKPAAPPAQASAPAHRKPEARPAHPAAEPTPEAPARPRKKPDPAAILEGRADGADTPEPAAQGGSKYVIQLAALSDPAKADALRGKLSEIGVQARFSKVQTSKGEATRVRVGPFASRDEANAVLRKLARAGVSGIIVGVRAP